MKITLLDAASIEEAGDVRLPAAGDVEFPDLVESIRRYGLLNPITVVPTEEGRYRVVAGRRRFRACRALNMQRIPAVVVELGESDQMALALVENIQRKQLSPVEEATALDSLIKKYGLTQEEVAMTIGKSRSYVANRLRLLSADEDTRVAVHHGDITPAHAAELMRLEDSEWRRYYLQQTVEYGFSVNALKHLIDQYLLIHATPPAPEELAQQAQQVEPREHLLVCNLCRASMPASEARTLLICKVCEDTIRRAMATAQA